MKGLRPPIYEVFILLSMVYTISGLSIIKNHVHVKTNSELKAQHRSPEPEWTSYNTREQDGPGSYSFGFDTEDIDSGNVQFRQEKRGNDGSVIGSYGHVEPDGNVQVVHYIADEKGYRATIENSKRSSYSIPNSSEMIVPTPSPQFAAALASLDNLKIPQNKQEEHVRPLSQMDINSIHAVNKLDENIPLINDPTDKEDSQVYYPTFHEKDVSKYPSPSKFGPALYNRNSLTPNIQQGFNEMKPYYIGKISYVLQPNQFVIPAKNSGINAPSYYYVPNQQFVLRSFH